MITRKRFGQHFLDSPQVIADIVAAVGPQPGDHVVEIGPGRGALTQGLYGMPGLLSLIEIDRDLVPGLRHRFPRAPLYNIDVLDFDFSSLDPAPLRIVGNLPYNISTPLLLHLLAFEARITDMHFMLQREVAERIVAEPGSKTWGRLSVLLQYFCTAELLFEVSPACFQPPPEVWSAVIRLRPRREGRAAVDMHAFDRVLKAVFGQRRKQLGNTLRQLMPLEHWVAAGIRLDFKARAESVTLADFVWLATTLARHEAATGAQDGKETGP